MDSGCKLCRKFFLLTATAIRESRFFPDSILSGMAKGPDTYAIHYAKIEKIPVFFFPANWLRHGKRAGILRNIQMAQQADALIAVWDGTSHGTKHMIEEMQSRNKPVFIKSLAKHAESPVTASLMPASREIADLSNRGRNADLLSPKSPRES